MKKRKRVSAIFIFLAVLISVFSGCGVNRKDEPSVITEKNTAALADVEKSTEASRDKEKNTTKADDKTTAESESESESESGSESGSETKAADGETTEAVTASEAEHFFDSAVFVGDSVTLGLRNYVTSERNKGHECLGKAVFLTAGSMGYTNTLRKIGEVDSIHPKYKGKEMTIEDALALIKPEKVFIMLGMNDFFIYSAEEGVGNAAECINRIKEKNPETDIYIESVTPVNRDRGNFSNANIDKFNAALKKYCGENGCTYVDIASVMKDPDGAFIEDYCSDPNGKGIHMTYKGCKAWVAYLNKNYGKEK